VKQTTIKQATASFLWFQLNAKHEVKHHSWSVLRAGR